jgi:hypothetical protein
MGIDVERRLNVGSFTSGQKLFLEYHRENVLLESVVQIGADPWNPWPFLTAGHCDS